VYSKTASNSARPQAIAVKLQSHEVRSVKSERRF
jgi:hypothetical protein